MKRLCSVALLCVSLFLLWFGGQIGRDSLRVTRESGCRLWLPPEHEARPSPAVVICGHDGGLAKELSRRGYAVANVGQNADLAAAFALLCSRDSVGKELLALVAVGQTAGENALAYAHSAEPPFRALVLLRCSEDGEALKCNILCIGEEETSLSGYFADGSARAGVPYRNRRQAAEATISWLGSSLGHPRDGVYADDELIFPLANACRVLGCTIFAATVGALRKKKHEECTI